MTQSQQRTPHRSTQRVLDILKTLAAHDAGMTMSEVCRELEAPKSSLFTILHTMAEQGFIAFDEASGRYTVGLRTFLVGSAYARNHDDVALIGEQLEWLTRQTGETSQAGILEGGRVLYIAKSDSPQPVRLSSQIGRTLPVHCTAIGKALACDLSLPELEALVGTTPERLTQLTICDLDKLAQELAHVRQTRIAHEHGETAEGLECTATAVRLGGVARYGIGVSAPSFRMDDEKRREVEQLLAQARQHLEAVLAHK